MRTLQPRTLRPLPLTVGPVFTIEHGGPIVVRSERRAPDGELGWVWRAAGHSVPPHGN